MAERLVRRELSAGIVVKQKTARRDSGRFVEIERACLAARRSFFQLRSHRRARLHVRHRRALRLGKVDFGTQDQGAKDQISQRQHHVEILVHVAVVQEMMTIQAEIDAGTFDIPFLGQVHAPVHVFVSAVVAAGSHDCAREDRPMTGDPTGDDERNDGQEHEHRAIPPSHGDGLLVLIIDQMVGVIRLEHMMMDDGMRLEGVIKATNHPVHDVAVQSPFKE